MPLRLLLVLLIAVAASAQDENKKALDLGQRTWSTNCAACHFVPTPSVPSDRMWIGMLQTTS